MKLRTTHNSIRLRLRKSEVDELRQKGKISESIKFPDGQCFQYSFVSDSVGKLSVLCENNHMIIRLPSDQVLEWIKTDQVSISHSLPLPENDRLEILIEKDFPCTERADEDKSDTFWELDPKSGKAC